MKKKLAVCVTTYHRNDLVNEFLNTQMDIYDKYDVDVWIYESNEDTQCSEMIKKSMNKYNNLHCVSLSPETHSNAKVIRIYEGIDRDVQYDYIWMTQEAYRIEDEELKEILQVLDRGYDFVIVANNDKLNIGNKEYTNILDFFHDGAYLTAGYGRCIVKTGTMIKGVDWDYICNKYLVPESINFSHVGYLYEQLSDISNPKMYYKSVEHSRYHWSELKKVSSWLNDVFFIMCESWPATINKLPVCYNGMKKAVIKSHGIYSGVLSYGNFLKYREHGIYNSEVYERYKGNWNSFCDIEEKDLENLSIKTVEQFEDDRIIDFYRRFDRVYVYGCGVKARKVADILHRYNMEWEAFLVSDISKCLKSFLNHDVKEFRSELLEGDVGIIMGLNAHNYSEVMETYNLKEYENRILKMY
jgi:hypothetical protein